MRALPDVNVLITLVVALPQRTAMRQNPPLSRTIESLP
jgi:hypothetical protein